MPENFIINPLQASSRPQYAALLETATDTTNRYFKLL